MPKTAILLFVHATFGYDCCDMFLCNGRARAYGRGPGKAGRQTADNWPGNTCPATVRIADEGWVCGKEFSENFICLVFFFSTLPLSPRLHAPSPPPLRLERHAWSVIALLRQSINYHAPPPRGRLQGGTVVPHWFGTRDFVEVMSPCGTTVRVKEGKRRDPFSVLAFATQYPDKTRAYFHVRPRRPNIDTPRVEMIISPILTSMPRLFRA